MSTLRISLLGGFTLEGPGGPLPTIPSLPARSLFAYLIMQRHQAHTRDRLAYLFWIDLDETTARRRLSHALWEIGHTLDAMTASDYLLIDRESIRFNLDAPYWLDVEAFDAGIQASREGPPPAAIATLEDAVALYHGDFLAGFYDDWVVREQDRLRERYLEALHRLVELNKAQGNYKSAATHAGELVHYDPLQEEAHRELMRLYFLLGRPHDAIQQYRECYDVMTEEFGFEPSPETTALYQEIQTHVRQEQTQPRVSSAARSAQEGAPFIGRREDQATLIGALESTLDGQGGVALVEGEPGIGKTRLLTHIADDARWRGFQVLWAESQTLDEFSPYGRLRAELSTGLSPLRARQLLEIVDGIHLRTICRLVPQLEEWLPNLPSPVSLRPEYERQRTLDAITSILLALPQIAPHVLILDDLQWADAGTLDVLSHLAPRIDDHRLLIIAGYRSEEARTRTEVWDVIRSIDQTAGRARITLTPFSDLELASLVQHESELREIPPEFSRMLRRDSGGNPLFVIETLRALRDHGLLTRDDAGTARIVWEKIDGTLPLAPALHDIIANRLNTLRAPVRSTLNTAAVLGDRFELSALLHANPLNTSETLSALEDLLQRGLLRDGDGSPENSAYRFSHGKIQEVAYDLIPDNERRRLHDTAGTALEDAGSAAHEQLAHHFVEAEVWDKAVQYAQAAGDQAAGLQAYPTAIEHYNRAIAYMDAADLSREQRIDLLTEREQIHNILGNRDEQAADLDRLEVLTREEPTRLSYILRHRAWMHAQMGDFDEAEEAARQALQLAEDAGNDDARAASQIRLGMVINRRGNVSEAVKPLREAVTYYAGQDDVRREAQARFSLGSVLGNMFNYQEGRAETKAALELFEQIDDRMGHADTLGLLGTYHMEQGEPVAAERCYRQAYELARAIGYKRAEAINLLNWGNLLVFRGALQPALDRYDQATDAFEAMNDELGTAFVLANAASLRYSSLGDHDRAEADANAALVVYDKIGNASGQSHCHDVLGGIARCRGDLDTAEEHFRIGLTKAKEGEDLWMQGWLHWNASRFQLDKDNLEEAHMHAETGLQIARDLELADLITSLLAVRGLILSQRGDCEAAIAATSEAMNRLTASVHLGHLVPYWHYRVLTACGQEEAAHAALTDAYERLQQLLDGISPEQREMSLTQIPEHSAIEAAWEAITPQYVSVQLAHVDAPTGRPLEDDDLVAVQWTVETPEDETIRGKKARRQHRIRRLLREADEQDAAPTLDDLADVLDVSTATIKRDLAALRNAGYEVQTRGSR